MVEKLVVYSASDCIWCKKEKEWLKENKIDFIEKDVSDKKNAKEMMEKSGQMGTPVSILGDEIVVGFDQDKLSEILKIK